MMVLHAVESSWIRTLISIFRTHSTHLFEQHFSNELFGVVNECSLLHMADVLGFFFVRKRESINQHSNQTPIQRSDNFGADGARKVGIETEKNFQQEIL